MARPARLLTPCDRRPDRCPNCGDACDSLRSPYCGEHCREEAAFVRQYRAARANDHIDTDKLTSLAQVLWHLLGGGYPIRQAMVPDRAIQQVLAKANGGCEACGSPADRVDHRKTACNRPINLRAVCAICNADRPIGDPEVLARSAERIDMITARILAEEPVCRCDGQDWDWRAYLAERAIHVSP